MKNIFNILLVWPVIALCQGSATLSGVVSDAATNQPLAGVNVYLAATTLGVSTGSDGRFFLNHVPPGVYTLVASRVGYSFQSLSLDMRPGISYTRILRLSPLLIPLEDVEVRAVSPVDAAKQRDAFRRVFLGVGPFAASCRILNPDVLSIRWNPMSDTLTATTAGELTIENNALGYRLRIAIRDFGWDMRKDCGSYIIYPYFEESDSTRTDSLTVWKSNREKAYRGSMQHFLKALFNGKTNEEGFVVYKGDLDKLRMHHATYVFPEELQLDTVPYSSLKRWNFDGWLGVDIRIDGVTRSSFIRLTHPTVDIDPSGTTEDPIGITVLGDWSEKRVADMLPSD